MPRECKSLPPSEGSLVGRSARVTAGTDRQLAENLHRTDPRPNRLNSHNHPFELIRECHCFNYMSIARILLLGLIGRVTQCRENCKPLIPNEERPSRCARKRPLN